MAYCDLWRKAMKTHRIIATPWQIESARRGALKTVILPIVPEPIEQDDIFVWKCEPIDLFWFKTESVGDRLIKKLPYQTGDRLYFAEQWCKTPWGNDEGKITCDIYFTESATPEAELFGWQPAETMPPEAAQYWFEVVGVTAKRLGQVSFRSFAESGLHLICPEVNYPSYEHQAAWNRSYPDTPWSDDLWVQVLEVKQHNP
jgi:hypothetical protein